MPPETKRARKSSAPEPELVEEASDDRLPIQKLCDALILGARKQKVWHRRTLGLGNRRYLNTDEEQQLSTELMLLEQHLNEPSVQELKAKQKVSARYVRSKKFRKTKVDPITLTYFIEVAWGLSTGFYLSLEQRLKD